MKKHMKLLLTAACAIALNVIPAEAEEFSASEYTGAQISEKIVTASEAEAAIVYEWHLINGGMYDVSFNDAVSDDCSITAVINGGYTVNIADITKTFELGFDAGINRIELNITKNSDSGEFSVGTVSLEYTGEIDTSAVHFECNNYTAVDAQTGYYENYGSDMSGGDVTRYQRAGRSATAEFAVYAPCSGEYAAEIVMSDVGKAYTSDVNMSVNGADYLLSVDTVTKLANLTNASDAGLMKRFKLNNTVTLNQGVNSIVFSSTESRYSDTTHIYFLDCVDFAFANEAIEIAAAAENKGEYQYAVTPSADAEYFVDISLVTKPENPLHELADCSFSTDGVSYTALSKGTAENAFADKTVEIISEYAEDGALYGVYRLKNSILPKNTVFLKIGSEPCKVEKIVLTPAVSGLKEIYASSDKSVLLPGETADISVFAKDKKGYALNLDFLRKNGAVTFKSSDRDILAVDALGNVTALDTGIAKITVSVSDGTDTYSYDVDFNVYNESYGFTVLSAEKADGNVKVKLLSPFGTRTEEHIMMIAEYQDNTLINVTYHQVNGLLKGQIMTYKMPASENKFKVISLSGVNTMQPVYEAVSVK